MKILAHPERCETARPAGQRASRPSRRLAIALGVGCWLGGASLERHAHAAPSQDPTSAPPAPAPPAPEPVTPEGAPADAITPPRLSGDALVEYPDGAAGSAEVVLELLIGASGDVLEASVVEGHEPFAGAARTRALGWRFVPAQSGGKPRAARIRFAIRFTAPPTRPDAAEAAGDPGTPSPGQVAAASVPEPIEVTVRGRREDPRAQTLTRAEVRQLPGAFGDPFRAIEALPGVTPILSGVPFFYVRGAPPGNVGYYLDGIRLPLLYHVGLGPSVVHPAMVARVDLYPGAYPTRYGRFSGGIVAGEVEAPKDQWHGEWQIRLFDAGVMTEAPLFGGRGHVLVGGRYSYTAYLVSLLGENVRLEYWDYQLRAGYQLGRADELSVFAFGSFDYFGEDTSDADDDLLSTEFHRIDLRHDHQFSEASRLRSAATWGFDRTRVSESGGFALDRRLSLRTELEANVAPGLRLSAGADAVTDAYSVEPNDIDNEDPAFSDPESNDIDGEDELQRLFPSRRDSVVGAYVELAAELASFVTLVPGLRFDTYTSSGALAYSFEPRVSATFRVSENLSLKNALGLAAQPPSFVVPVAGFEIGGLPGGLQRSLQSSAGAEYRLPDAMKLSLTFFHNAFFNMTDVLSLVRLDDAEEELQLDTRTRGQAYGMELMFHRDLTRRLGGFLSYTLSRSQRYTPYGRIAAAFDRTHVLNAVLAYDLGQRWRAGGRLVFYTGNPEFSFDNLETERRLPPFHRLDVRLEKRWPIGDSGAFWALVLEVLNTTLSREVVSRQCDVDGDCDDDIVGPVTIPSIAFEGRF